MGYKKKPANGYETFFSFFSKKKKLIFECFLLFEYFSYFNRVSQTTQEPKKKSDLRIEIKYLWHSVLERSLEFFPVELENYSNHGEGFRT